MNLVFISGKIISNIEFKFIINSKKISIVTFFMELNNKSIVKIIAYDEKADYIYKKINKNDNVLIYGNIEKEIIEVIKLERFYK